MSDVVAIGSDVRAVMKCSMLSSFISEVVSFLLPICQNFELMFDNFSQPCRLDFAMTSIVDSKAHFLKRCREVGLSDRAINALTANGFETLGTLAFGVGQPGVALVDSQFQTFARNCLGALATIAEISTLKRLVFESHAMLLAQLREQVSNPQASASRPLPVVEREAKLRDLRAQLGGVVTEQQLEPSHHLIDLFSQQWEAKQLEYVSPEKCTSREWEITRGKSNKQLSLDNEKLLIKEEKSVPDQPVTSSELLILESMRRRGVAMACVDIISWEVHERI